MTQAPATPELVERLRSPVAASMTAEKILSTVEFDTNGGCWLWPRSDNGYGYSRIGRQRAHRVAFEVFVGPIPEGLVIDHMCMVRACVNPAHLRAVTVEVNSIENSNSMSTRNRMVTHCPAGHEYNAENTGLRRRRSSVIRVCRACQRRHSANWRRAQALSSQGRHEGGD